MQYTTPTRPVASRANVKLEKRPRKIQETGQGLVEMLCAPDTDAVAIEFTPVSIRPKDLDV